MTLPCSRNLTQQPAFGGDDIAFCAFGLGTKTRHLRWVTLSERKWVILAEYRGSIEFYNFDPLSDATLSGSGALLVQPSRVRRSYRKETKAVDRMSESSDAELNKN